jgi:HD-GYP domain-containing protein (c-di-GMP phosphodiesterase class II)
VPEMQQVTPGRVSVPVSSLEPGLIVDRDIFSGAQRLLAAGALITPELLKTLQKRGIEYLEVRADSALAKRFFKPDAESDGLTTLLSRHKALYAQHGLEQAIPEEDLEQAVDQITGFFGEIEKGQSIDLNDMRHTVTSLVSQFLERSNLAVKLLDLDQFDRYTYRHSINAGLLFMMVSKDWGTEDDLVDMAFGAVLHDLGKARVGAAIINKEGPLTDEEWEIMRKHPGWSADLLKEADAAAPAISIARWHHEKIDGTGYPDHLSGNEIDRYARLAAVCDVYDALTTKRSYKQKMDFARAIDIIIRGCGKHFDPEIAHQFIRRIGRYPVGTFVKLNTAEIAVVLRANEHAISRPVVSRVLDASGNELTAAEELDLSKDFSRHITDMIMTPESARD